MFSCTACSRTVQYAVSPLFCVALDYLRCVRSRCCNWISIMKKQVLTKRKHFCKPCKPSPQSLFDDLVWHQVHALPSVEFRVPFDPNAPKLNQFWDEEVRCLLLRCTARRKRLALPATMYRSPVRCSVALRASLCTAVSCPLLRSFAQHTSRCPPLYAVRWHCMVS